MFQNLIITLISFQFDTSERNKPSHSLTSKACQPSNGISKYSAVNPQTLSMLTTQQSKPNVSLQHQSNISSTLSQLNKTDNLARLQQSECNVLRRLEPVGSSVNTTRREDDSSLLLRHPTMSTLSTSADVVAQYSLHTNFGLVTVQQCANNAESLCAAIAEQLFGPFHSLREQTLSAITLHRRAIDYVRKKKDLFFTLVKNFKNWVDPNHGLDPEMVFESGCFDLLEGTDELSQKGHNVLLQVIACLFNTSICVYEEGKKEGGIVTLELAFKFDFNTGKGRSLSSFTSPISILKSKCFKNHYDSLIFEKSSHTVQDT